jgi:hypothetical protein
VNRLLRFPSISQRKTTFRQTSEVRSACALIRQSRRAIILIMQNSASVICGGPDFLPTTAGSLCRSSHLHLKTAFPDCFHAVSAGRSTLSPASVFSSISEVASGETGGCVSYTGVVATTKYQTNV